MDESAEASSREPTRFRLKMGAAEIEFVGEAATLKDTVIPVANKMISLVDSHTNLQRPSDRPLQIKADAKTPDALDMKPLQEEKSASQFGHSTNTIAVHLKAESGPDLAMAASAHLCLVKGQARFTRREILDEMKSATGFFKTSMRANLSNTLTRLTSDNRLHLVGPDAYALPNDERTRLEKVLAQIK
jgi:hypothetical protein